MITVKFIGGYWHILVNDKSVMTCTSLQRAMEILS
jgi:hypothetical protein